MNRVGSLRHRLVLTAAAFALLLGLVPSGAVTPLSLDPSPAGSFLGSVPVGANADVRSLSAHAPSATAARAASSLASQIRDLSVRWNARMGTVKSVFSREGFLTEPAGGLVSLSAAEQIARSWIAAHRDLFGLSSSSALTVTTASAMPDGGPIVVVFRQMYGAIPTFAGGTIGVSLSRDGRVSSVWADTGRSSTLPSTPRLSAADALRAVAGREGVSLTVQPLGARAFGDRLSIFAAGGAYGPHNARLVAFPTADGPRLAWRVFFAKAGDQMLSTVVDAFSGVVLFRSNEVNFEKGDTGRVFRNHPGAAKGGTADLVSFEGDPVASPQGWMTIAAAGAPGPSTTIGNNGLAFNDWAWPALAGGGFAPAFTGAQANPLPQSMPVSATRSLDFAFTNEWSKSCGAAVTSQLTGDAVQSPSYVRDRDASVTNAFYFLNSIHDFAYKYGFTEEYNMQSQNFSGKGKAMDAVRVMTQAGIVGGQLDNAFMFTPADGGEPAQFTDPANPTKILDYYPPFSGMFLWKPVDGYNAPCVDGAQDASIVYHEYTHGISNRMTGGADDVDALSAQQSGSMGEAWSDWVAALILDSQGLLQRPVEGVYATGNALSGIRNYAMDRSPLTYGDFGYGLGGPEVHDDGEIWMATLWDARDALVAKYGKAKGDDRAVHLVFDGLATQPRLPDMLDARDAILNADKVRYHNADKALLWKVFAARGMGVGAASKSASDVSPRPSFAAPSGNGVLQGSVHDVSGLPVFAKLYVGLASGKPTPIAASSPSTGAFKLAMAPGVYPLTAGAAGYGMQKIGSITIKAGKSTSVAISMKRNLASAGWGARVISGAPAGSTAIALLDDHEFTGQVVTVGTPLVVQLAGSAPANITSVAVTPRPASSDALSAPESYSVQLSVDGHRWRPAIIAGVKWTKPAPTSSAWTQVTRPISGKARFARVLVSSATGGGATAILAGLQVYGSAPGMKAATPRASAVFKDAIGAIATANRTAPAGSVTLTEFDSVCHGAPVTQGVDAYVLTLPAGAGDGIHQMATKGGDEAGRDLDVYFFDSACRVIGAVATPSADETGPVPPGSMYAGIALYAGSTNGFTVSVSSTIERVIPPKGVGVVKAPGGPVGRTETRSYVGGTGDLFATFGCDGTAPGGTAIGGTCFAMKPGEHVSFKLTDSLNSNVSGSYAFIVNPSDPLESPIFYTFCDGFKDVAPDGITELDVYIDEAFSVMSDCGGSPGTSGTAAAVIS